MRKTVRQKLSEAHAVVRERLGEVHKHQAHIYTMRAVPIVFEPGQSVWLLVPAIPVGTSAKFARLWCGPFTVIEKLSDVVYRVEGTRQTG